jgi:hypothetical protein
MLDNRIITPQNGNLPLPGRRSVPVQMGKVQLVKWIGAGVFLFNPRLSPFKSGKAEISLRAIIGQSEFDEIPAILSAEYENRSTDENFFPPS